MFNFQIKTVTPVYGLSILSVVAISFFLFWFVSLDNRCLTDSLFSSS